MGSDGIYGGKAKSKRCVFRYFLKVATEINCISSLKIPQVREYLVLCSPLSARVVIKVGMDLLTLEIALQPECIVPYDLPIPSSLIRCNIFCGSQVLIILRQAFDD